jgi:MYXO-CTERM domain-containing protein
LVSWDIDYDRVYEIPGASDREIKVPLPKEGLTVVAKAIDPTGRSARALLVVSGEPLDAGTGAEPEPDAAADAAADAPADTGAQDSSSVSGGAQRNENGDGCGCGVAGGSSGGGWGAGTLAALLALCALRNKRATA